MSQILWELERLREALTKPQTVESAELLAEELAARSFDQPYKWSSDEFAARIDLPTGLSVAIRGDERRKVVEARVEWMRTDPSSHYSKVTKWLPRASEQAYSILSKARWKVCPGAKAGYTGGTTATIETRALRADISTSTEAIRAAMGAFTFTG